MKLTKYVLPKRYKNKVFDFLVGLNKVLNDVGGGVLG